ncbi:hypothetical protein ASF38_15755 [Aeromicrobium sp. Leaf272]|nr:hypothetical protein ASF38_15755 [Aeromicrobium sp. Leaf272]
MTLGAVALTLRHERRLQDSNALETELQRLLADLRSFAPRIGAMRELHQRVEIENEMTMWVRQARRVLPAVQRELSPRAAALLGELLGDTGEHPDAADSTLRPLARLEALLTETVLTPEKLTPSRLAHLSHLRMNGERFD